MNGRERFLTALHGGIPDRVPLFETHFCLRFVREIVGDITSPHHNVDDQVAVARAIGLDMVWSAPLGFTSFANVQQHGERYQDEWGTWYGSDEGSWPGSWARAHGCQQSCRVARAHISRSRLAGRAWNSPSEP